MEGLERAAIEQGQWQEQCEGLKAEVAASQQASGGMRELLAEMEKKEKLMAEQGEALQVAQAQLEELRQEVERGQQAMEEKEGMVRQLQEASETLQRKVLALEEERHSQQLHTAELPRGPFCFFFTPMGLVCHFVWRDCVALPYNSLFVMTQPMH